ncbi:MAG: OmpA family protein [Sulfuriferula sp.]|nr:OmpA family protein [Sulfuriferula sp.]
MINAMFRMKRLPLATLTALALLHGTSHAADEIVGKRVDNARVDVHALPAPGERQPDIPYVLPSGVTREEVQIMRADNAALPTRTPDARSALSEHEVGALFASGKADLTDAAKRQLDALVTSMAGKSGLRIAVVGHTDNQHLASATRRLFKNNQGLSEARALAVANYLMRALKLSATQMAISGKGETVPVASNNTPDGMARNRRVEVTVWFDAPPVALPAKPAVPVVASPCAAVAGSADLPFRVTVDGEPMAMNEPVNEADRQRCTDVALSKADIQVKYDDLAAKPSLNVWVTPDTALKGEPVEFRGYANYVVWLRKAEVRIFRKGQKPDEQPLAALPLAWEKPVTWTVPADGDDTYLYVLRVYDEKGRFDETAVKTISAIAHRRPVNDADKPSREALTGWGENALALRNIPVKGGTITVSGRDLKADESVTALGLPVPVDHSGRFVLRQILPSGPQSVDVRVTEANGKFVAFRRNLSIPDNDWFYIAIGDITAGHNYVAGPAQLVTSDTQHYNNDTYIDGRGAFYLKGKVKGEWLLTAAADTTEQPLNAVFSNFSSKNPYYLLRNIDPNMYYPVYGDDSTTVDDAPTQGKFYVRLEKGDSRVMWGNFRTQWSGSELIQYSRGLYGANARYRSEAATTFGMKKTSVDAFAADPGTLAARDEFRGTGGSLYYLHQQDITQGSEHVWVEVRDKDSGLVLERKDLVPSQDYDVDYLQGRILLHEPLPSTAGGGGLVFTSANNGQPLYLVSTYEYVPGVAAVSSMVTGVRASQWVNDKVKLGVTSYHQGDTGADQTLKGVDVTFRVAPGTSVKAELARSSGAGTGVNTSIDGGFGFNGLNTGGQSADAKRVDATADLAEVIAGGRGKIQTYWQDNARGFSSPGQIAVNGEAVRQQGFKADVPVGKQDVVSVKSSVRNADSQDTSSFEVAWKHVIDSEWALSLGARHDQRTTLIPNASPTLSQNGMRTDVITRADYLPLKKGGKLGEKEDWSAYGFVQGTTELTGTRDANNRAGVGGSWHLTDRIKVNAEASDGSMGAGGRLGTDYRMSDRSNAYLTYVLASEDPDSAYRGRTGTLVSGSDYRVSDQMRLFGENRMSSGAGPQSLTQAFGVDLAPNDRWNYGGKFETGKVSDPLAGDLKRVAIAFSMGYKFERTKYAGNLEYRSENSTLSGIRHVWLMRNSYGQQYSMAWRLIGKFNFSRSDNTQGAFYDGDYHELVLGAAYRPVDNDRWNTLLKYTNFYNLPSPGQLAASGTVADYAQKSQIFSVDTIYDVWPWLSVGLKYGLRIGELQDSKVGGDWYTSRADLLVLRTDWHLVKEWDAVAELRDLRVQEAQDASAGALLAIYRHVGEHMKVGVGFNFTNYSDDLTDLSYRSRGWFVNAVAKY